VAQLVDSHPTLCLTDLQQSVIALDRHQIVMFWQQRGINVRHLVLSRKDKPEVEGLTVGVESSEEGVDACERVNAVMGMR
jgi:hypothetical protein